MKARLFKAAASAFIVRHTCLISTALLTVFSAVPLQADPPEVINDLKTAPSNIYVDCWVGQKQNTNRAITKFHLEIEASNLIFSTVDNGILTAHYITEIIIRDQDGEISERKISDQEFEVRRFDDTYQNGGHLSEIQFDGLPPGRYAAHIVITDRNSQHETAVELPFRVADYSSATLSVSDIQLSKQCDIPDPQKSDSTISCILPHPAGSFGLDARQLYYYFELYSSEYAPGDSVEFQISCIGPDEQTVLSEQGVIRLLGGATPVFRSIDTSGFPAGNYRMLVEFTDERLAEALTCQKFFYVSQNPADTRFRPYDEIVAELALIATPAEMVSLQVMDELLQQEQLDAFWRERDPTSSTDRNEAMIEFYHRLKLAKRWFGARQEDGPGISDKGKVFVLHGPPEGIRHRRGRMRNSMVEIWDYLKAPRTVVFLDGNGFGNYRLIRPVALLD